MKKRTKDTMNRLNKVISNHKSFYKEHTFIIFGIIIIILLILLSISSTQLANMEKEYETYKKVSLEFQITLASGIEACVDYCNITQEDYKMILFDYMVEKKRLELNQSITKEVENNE